MRRSRFEEYKGIWMRRTSQYADEFGSVHFAKVVPYPHPIATYRVSNYPRPDEVEHLISAVLEQGGPRHYCFQTEEERDAFVATYSEYASPDGSLTK